MAKNQIPESLRDTLIEFTMTTLLYHPSNIITYAGEYFKNLKRQRKIPITYDYDRESSESAVSEESSEPEMPEPRATRRIAVSGESYDPKKAAEAFVKPVYEKTDEEMERLRNVALNTLLFRTLDEEQLEDILNAVFKKCVKPGEIIIEQGEDGDNFYVIEEGKFNVYQAQPGEERQYIHSYHDSGFFGELALLYNQPRAATVIAATDGIIWALDRKTFRHIVVQAAIEKRTRYEDFIETVPILEYLSSYEKNQLVDAFTPKKFSYGDEIYLNGDDPDEAVRDTLLEFTMCALLYQPKSIRTFAQEHLMELKSLRQTRRVYDERLKDKHIIETVRTDSTSSDETDQFRTHRRTSVYGEPCSSADLLKEYVKPVFSKTDEEMTILRIVAKNTVLFRALDDVQITDVVNALFRRPVTANEVIIRQGDDGDYFYVIERGTYQVYQSRGGEAPLLIRTYDNFGFFGELALLYNQPRAATVVAATDGLLWALDRFTFRQIVVRSAIEKRERYVNFIETVPLLAYLSTYEKNLLIDAFVQKTFKNRSIIYKSHHEPDGIYFVEEGEVHLMVKDRYGTEVKVDKAEVGDYFGENSVISHRPRKETAVAACDVKLAFLDIEAVHTILEPCMAALKEKAASRDKNFRRSSRSSTSVSSVTSEPEIPPPRSQRPARRIAVSGESYDPRKIAQESFVKPVYEKTPEEMETLRFVAENTLLFRTLEEEQLTDILNAVFKKEVSKGDVIIKQGDDGDNFYVIEKGKFDVYMQQPGKDEQLIHTYQDSGFFGELALLYNQPRAATVIATTDGVIWALDRNTFRRIVVQAAFEKRSRFEDLIERIPLLRNLGSYEKSTLVDALTPKRFLEGATIYQDFNNVDGMYFVEEGVVLIQVQDSSGNYSDFQKIKANEFFGYVDILFNRPRTAIAKVVEDCKLAFLDVDQFHTLLGSCMEALQREGDVYEQLRINAAEGL